ncbi:preprotein translocase subunit SecE [Desulfovibrio psychrotolerans]|uniref:Protein translocase subunit SecE n=1 Tax=Desulfovibrio psychrotolerans TaxID=415242 RepID=A0A7J0BXX8_9BACT|nr:preprotein translocase subunit SecE [Desulfovibrio psychrotolerans]GFM37854.1 protein translocase subunit SecE [Desulfovibrio psychrotolerans]
MANKHSKKADKANDSQVGVESKITQLKEFFEESQVEIKKVVWPSRKETVTTGVAVLVLVVVMSIFLGVIDLGLTKLVEYILS